MNEANKKKALVVSTVASTIDQFCMNSIQILNNDYEVVIAANFHKGNNTSKERIEEFKSELDESSIKIVQINFDRNPLSKVNFLCYRDIKILLKSNIFEIIHCHTPVAAMIVRLAARKVRKRGTRVIYTAHGFHFFKGAPLKNWLLYYPVERLLSRYTDVIITINKEDYAIAKKLFKATSVEHIPGVGIDTKKFGEVVVDKSSKRIELGIPENAFVVLSVGELNKNKNHETVIKAIAKLNNRNVYYVICGHGSLEKYLINLTKKLSIEKQVKILGYRRDVAQISKVSDLFVFPSYREGLSVALMEAMASGLEVACSNIRGNNDLIEAGEGGFLVEPCNVEGFTEAIDAIINNSGTRENRVEYNKEVIMKYDINNVNECMKNIYFGLKTEE